MKKGLLVALIAIIADQLHKYLMIYKLGFGQLAANGLPVTESGHKAMEVTSFFNLVMVWNHGVSFGMLNSGSVAAYQPLMLTGMAIIIIIALLAWLRKAKNKWQILGI